MRGWTRRWIMEDAPAANGAAGTEPRPLIERILAARGFTDPDEIARFREPKLNHLHDPGLMPGIDRAVERLVRAVKQDQSIVIYGDYDVDGITAAAILYHIIKRAKPETRVSTYVPHRIEEGYGLNSDALKQIRADGADVVISVDCGITAVEPARLAREIGLDLIITDHHNMPEGELPDAYALVHPRLPDSAYPFGALCGAGVAFKLAWRFSTCWCGSERVGEVMQQTLLHMLPLVALGTIADVVPLVGENRVLATFGLRLIKQTPLPGLKALIEASDLMDERIDCEKVGYVLGPRLNACGRLGHAGQAVRMFTDAEPEEAASIARELTRINQQRQRTERGILDEAAAMAEDAGMTDDSCRAIVLAAEHWHPGVVGIVCSRLVDRFGRPAILLQRNGEYCKGSGRSIEGYSIHEGLLSCHELLTTYGGHDMAAGMTLPVEHLEMFRERFLEHARAHIEPDHLVPALRIDCDVCLSELDLPIVQRIGRFSPFGRANPKPALRVAGATVAEAPRQIGGQGRHLSVRLRQDGSHQQRRVVRAVWWNAGQYAADLAPGMKVDAVIEPKVNTWNGRTSVEAELKDIRVLGG